MAEDDPEGEAGVLARLNRVEGELERLRSEVALLQQRSLRFRLYEKFRPRLFRFRQYAPRELRLGSRPADPLPAVPPSIGLVTPSLNYGHLIGATVESVLGQSYPRLSYLVQDGASTDGTREVLARFGPQLNWSSEPDAGQAAAVNKALSGLDVEVMGYLNADDLLAPGCLAAVAAFFASRPAVDVIYGHRIVIDEAGDEVGRWILPPHDPEAIRWADYIPQETMFWRRRVWEALGGLDTGFRFAMDWDFILRAQEAGFRFARLSRFLGCFRLHAAQKTSTLRSVGEEESARLRLRTFGYVPPRDEVERHLHRYVRRHLLYHRLYKLKLLPV